ncbi:hypothetical protein EAH89_26175 [Roseomonas nepalensis]|uniref:Uncharacterized protein n=2 Tax=Muricoccus nepalensis TaxID=1854500 RepID=A0A502F8H2_9PROT|nr:hypothetical protein EAH89_26175 [Roseomonas nepalensis]
MGGAAVAVSSAPAMPSLASGAFIPERLPDRPELAVFEALGTTQGWTPGRWNDEELVHFEIETSATDAVSLDLQDHGPEFGGLALILTMYPEDEFAGATPQQMAAKAARWLRDAAAKLEAAAGGAA